jgi:hypothetical protein
MPKIKAKELYAELEPFIRDVAEERYDGNMEAGFRHWAFAELFSEQEGLSEQFVEERTRIDAPSDLGIDGYVADTDQKVFYLFQAKHLKPGSTVGLEPLTLLRNAPERLLSPDVVFATGREALKALREELRDAIGDGYAIHLIFATTGTFSAQANTFLTSNQDLHISIGDGRFVAGRMEGYDLRGLWELRRQNVEADVRAQPEVVWSLEHAKFHEVAGKNFRSIDLTVPVGRVIDVFKENGYAIFRLNPRGPLQNKVNRQILDTLKNETQRHNFHLFNNGITVICDWWRLEGYKLVVRDFQIVNGCQTTVTLHKARPLVEEDPQVLVNVRIIEAPQAMHKHIARTTNTQAPLKVEDFTSWEAKQRDLQQQFGVLRPPWFYEVKRGEWTIVKQRGQTGKYRDADGAHRVLKKTDVAQAALAFMGHPGEAKDRPRIVFEKRVQGERQGFYEDIFPEERSAIELLLPSLLFRHVKHETYVTYSKPDWAEYARFHKVWLIGELLRKHYRLPARSLPPRALAQELVNTIPYWLPGVLKLVDSAVEEAVDTAQKSGVYRGHREFFRSTENYALIVQELDPSIEQARRWGADPLASLPRERRA